MKYLTTIVYIFFLLLTASAKNPYVETRSEIGVDEQLGEYFPEDIRLFEPDGDTVIFTSLIDKPTIISFVYYRCPGICSPLMNGIAEMIDKSDMKIGEEYQVFTISFDYRETPELAKKKRMNYLSQVQKPQAQKGWFFFTGDSSNIAKITDAAGFRYKQTGNDFQHTAGLIVLSPDGKITRYLNGTDFLPFEIKMALVEASKGLPGPTINKILQLCYSYDPKGQQYVLNIKQISGVLIIFLTTGMFLFLVLKPLFRKKIIINKQ